MPGAERKKKVHEALERVGMGHRVKHYPSQLSGGQQQRVAVARALGGDPAILLADEPTGNLDSANGEAVIELLSGLHRAGATICMVTHDPRYAACADRTIRLFDGRVVEESLQTANVGGNCFLAGTHYRRPQTFSLVYSEVDRASAFQDNVQLKKKNTGVFVRLSLTIEFIGGFRPLPSLHNANRARGWCSVSAHRAWR